MRKFALGMAALLAAAAGAPALAAPADVMGAVASAARPAEDRALDASRKPAEVLRFMGLETGDRVLDLFAGSGYYTEIMAKAVGPRGLVLGWNPANFASAENAAKWAALKGRAANTGVFATPANALSLPTSAFDFVMLHLNYHDVYWEDAKFRFPRVDPKGFVRTVFETTKPGGVVAVIDHVAAPGGDVRAVVAKLHRMDPAVIRADFEAAGFVFDGESDVLRVPGDDLGKLVFDPAVRGKTDRVVYRFRKKG